MRKHSFALLAAAIGLAAAQASAADLPRKAPAYVPPAPPPITWTGCYIGANVGGIFGRAKADFGFGDISTDNSGFAGGGQIGCDYQFAGGWVIGIRNMFDGTSLHRDRTFIDPVSLTTASVDFKTQWFDTLTGRIGYAFAPGWLLYGQGGVAGLIPKQTSPSMVFHLATSARPEQAGRLVVALDVRAGLVGLSGRQLHELWRQRS
jgi:outer membrane immunogenic protein